MIEKRDDPFGLPSIGIPAELLFHPELTMTERVLFGYLRNLSQSSRGCYASNRWLGQLLQVGPQTISNSIAALKEWGFITVETTQKRGSKEVDRRIFIDDEYPKRYKKMVEMIHDVLNEEGSLIESDFTRIKKLIGSYSKTYRNQEREEEREPKSKSKSKTSLSQLAVATAEAEEILSEVKEKDKRYISFAQKLDEILQSIGRKKQKDSTLQSWSKHFRLLHQIEQIDVATINKTLEWYKLNIAKEYVPECHCAKSFRSKFSKLQSAIQRDKRPVRGNSIKPGHVAKDQTYNIVDRRINTEDL